MVTKCSIAVFSEFIIAADAVTKHSFIQQIEEALAACQAPVPAMTKGLPLAWAPRCDRSVCCRARGPAGGPARGPRAQRWLSVRPCLLPSPLSSCRNAVLIRSNRSAWPPAPVGLVLEARVAAPGRLLLGPRGERVCVRKAVAALLPVSCGCLASRSRGASVAGSGGDADRQWALVSSPRER